MEYKTLEKIYYSSPNDYEKIYLERYNGDYTHRLHFDIGGNKAFFIVTPDIQKKMLGIQRMDKTVSRLCAQLPGKAIEQFTKRCLIDELVLTNSIEGVSSTRREMYDVLEGMGRGEAKKRFTGLTQKYIMLQRGEGIRLETRPTACFSGRTRSAYAPARKRRSTAACTPSGRSSRRWSLRWNT